MNIEQYLTHLVDLDRSPSTVSNYRLILNQFIEWFTETNGPLNNPASVTPLDIKEFRRHLQNEQQAPRTINQKMAGLSSFFNWCLSNNTIAANPLANLKSIAINPAAPKWLTRKETFAILRKLEENIQLAQARGNPPKIELTIRNRCAIYLMLHAGLRVSEVVKLTREDIIISDRSGVVTVRSGKGNKYRVVPLNKDARRAIAAWLKLHNNEWIFSKGGRPITRRAVQQAVEALGLSTDIKLTAHMLRHTFGKSLIDAKVSIDRVALLMGHSNINTTKIYTIPSRADLASAVEKISWSD